MAGAVRRRVCAWALAMVVVCSCAAVLPAVAAADHWTFDSRRIVNALGSPTPPVTLVEDSNAGHPQPFVDLDERTGGFQCNTSAGVRTSTKTVWYQFSIDEAGAFAAGARSDAFDPHIVIGVFAFDGDVRSETCAAEEAADGNVFAPASFVFPGDTVLVAVGAASDCSTNEGAFSFAAAFSTGSAAKRGVQSRLGSGPVASASQGRCTPSGVGAPGGTPSPPPTPPNPGAPSRPGGPSVPGSTPNRPQNVRRITATAKLTAGSYLRLQGRRYVKLGIKARRLVLSRVPSGATVDVTCTRNACRRFRRVALSGRPVTITTLRNRRLRTGVRIEIRVTQAGKVGRFIRYTVKPNDFSKQERCIPIGSRTPRRSC